LGRLRRKDKEAGEKKHNQTGSHTKHGNLHWSSTKNCGDYSSPHPNAGLCRFTKGQESGCRKDEEELRMLKAGDRVKIRTTVFQEAVGTVVRVVPGRIKNIPREYVVKTPHGSHRFFVEQLELMRGDAGALFE